MSYDLRRLGLQGLIERQIPMNDYTLTPEGQHVPWRSWALISQPRVLFPTPAGPVIRRIRICSSGTRAHRRRPFGTPLRPVMIMLVVLLARTLPLGANLVWTGSTTWQCSGGWGTEGLEEQRKVAASQRVAPVGPRQCDRTEHLEEQDDVAWAHVSWERLIALSFSVHCLCQLSGLLRELYQLGRRRESAGQAALAYLQPMVARDFGPHL